jgi:ABC-type antimicrobial peptide transport system permease subunit
MRGPDPVGLTGPVRDAVTAQVPGAPPVELRGARRILSDALLPQRTGAIIVGGMGLAALILAAVGLYGQVQFAVTRGRHELAVRLALGGRGQDLLLVVLRKGFLLAAAGTVLGVAAAAALAPALGAFLGPVSPRDPPTYAAVVGAYVLVAFLASWLPARRAARVPPAEALHGG